MVMTSIDRSMYSAQVTGYLHPSYEEWWAKFGTPLELSGSRGNGFWCAKYQTVASVMLSVVIPCLSAGIGCRHGFPLKRLVVIISILHIFRRPWNTNLSSD